MTITDTRIEATRFDRDWAADVAFCAHIAPATSASLVALASGLLGGVSGLAIGAAVGLPLYAVLHKFDVSFLRAALRRKVGPVVLAARVLVPILCGTIAAGPVIDHFLAADVRERRAEQLTRHVHTRNAEIAGLFAPRIARETVEVERLAQQSLSTIKSGETRISELRRRELATEIDLDKAQKEQRLYELRFRCELKGADCDETSSRKAKRGPNAILAETLAGGAETRVKDFRAELERIQTELRSVASPTSEPEVLAQARRRLADAQAAERTSLAEVENEPAVRALRAEPGPVARMKLAYAIAREDSFVQLSFGLAEALLVTLELLGILMGASFARASKLGRDHRVLAKADDAEAMIAEAISAEREANAEIRARQAHQRVQEAKRSSKMSTRNHRLARMLEDIEIARNFTRRN